MSPCPLCRPYHLRVATVRFRVALTYVGVSFSEFNQCSGLLRRSPPSRAAHSFIRAAQNRAVSYSTASHAQDHNNRFHHRNEKVSPVPVWARAAASTFRTELGRPAVITRTAALVRNGAFATQKRRFHASDRCCGAPLIVVLAGLLKVGNRACLRPIRR